jgi:hypothetical protein
MKLKAGTICSNARVTHAKCSNVERGDFNMAAKKKAKKKK